MEEYLSENLTWLVTVAIIILIADTILKLITLWKSARRGQKAWYICLGIFNTCGILPLIYLYLHRKRGAISVE